MIGNTYQKSSVIQFIPMKKYDNMEKHPVEKIQNLRLYAEEELKMQSYANSFGSHLPMKLTIERMSLAKEGRLPGLKSSNLGLEIAMNKLNKIEFEDFLGSEREMMPKENIHMQFIKE